MAENCADWVSKCGVGPNVNRFPVSDGVGLELRPHLKNYRFTLFFDGTMNNRYNANKGPSAPSSYPKPENVLDNFYDCFSNASYWNDLSNVAKMSYLINRDTTNTKYDVHEVIYIEGIGTKKDLPDSNILGGGLGIGKYGVKERVEEAIALITSKIDGLYISDNDPLKTKLINLLTIDAIGFSRGAAAARYFIYRVKEEDAIWDKLKTDYKDAYDFKNSIITNTTIQFVGLFDTVASHWLKHADDPADLHLSAVKHAERVVQLTAADEYRKNFCLTDIASAKNGTQISLPGAHSDIGGGYPDDVTEHNWQLLDVNLANTLLKELTVISKRLEDERTWFIDRGWYNESEIDKKKSLKNPLNATRYNIKNTYSRIPLRIMIHHAEQQGLKFDRERLDKEEPIGIPKFPTWEIADFPQGTPMVYLPGDISHIASTGPEIMDGLKEAFTAFAYNKEVPDISWLNGSRFNMSILEVLDRLLHPKARQWCEEMALRGLYIVLQEDGQGNLGNNPAIQYMLMVVRHRYFHCSACYNETGMAPKFPNYNDIFNYFRKRKIFRDNLIPTKKDEEE